MPFRPELDFDSLFRDFASAVVVGTIAVEGVFSRSVEAHQFGSQDSTVLMADPNVLVRTSSLPALHIGDPIVVDGHAWTIRDRKAESDGRLTRLFLTEAY